MIPDDEILACVRSNHDPYESLQTLLELASRVEGGDCVTSLSNDEVEADIAEAMSWLSAESNGQPSAGIYFGLDTLNEDSGQGANIEIGFTGRTDSEPTNIEWVFDISEYGAGHLVRGLYRLHALYDHDKPKVSSEGRNVLDYVFFLGYGGIVLQAAVTRLYRSRETTYVWGFHDGDLAILCRGGTSGMTYIAEFA